MLLLFAATAMARAAAPEQSAQKLRSLSVLPSLQMYWGITSKELEHPEVRLGTNELARRIAALRKALNQTPGDTERYLQMGRYHEAAEQSDEAAASFSNAVPLLRLRAEARPRDATVQVQFAEALDGAGKVEEAEHVLRTVTRAVPDDWAGWSRLGQALDQKGLVALNGGTNGVRPDRSPAVRLTEMVQRRPTPNQVKEAEECQAEADKCFDRAVALAPSEPRAYLARALHRSSSASVKQFIVRFRVEQKFAPREVLQNLGSPEACADFAKIARLAPTNYAAIGYWGWMEAVPTLLNTANGRVIDSLTGERRKNFLESMRLLEGLAEHPNASLASGALEALGILRIMASADQDGAKTALRRAIALDPTRAQAWDGLVGLAAQSGDNQGLLSVCEERVKYTDTARNRVALAKACDRAGLTDKAIEHARQSTRLDPKDPTAHLCAGALLLRRSQDEKTAEEMKQHLLTARQLIEEMGDKDGRDALALNCGLNLAIVMALEGKTEEAREALRKLARLDAADDDAKEQIKEIETALGK